MTKLRVGILGTARIATTNIRAILLSKNTEVVAIGSRSIDKAAQFAKENGVPDAKVYGSYDELLADPNVDAVYIPLPTALHVEWVQKTANAKKHIMLEKPIALTTEDTKKLGEIAKAAGVVLMDGTMWMHNARVPPMKEAIQKIGKVRSFISNFTFCGDDDFFKNDIRCKADCDKLGCLGDLGWYCIRANLWAYGFEMPKSVRAHDGAIFNEEGVPLKLAATLVWEDGRIGTFDCSFYEGLQEWFVVSGSLGQLRVDDFVLANQESEASFSVTTNASFVVGRNPVERKQTVDTTVVPCHAAQQVQMWDTFADAIQGKADAAHWTDIAIKTQLVVCAVFESALKKETIHL